MSNIINLTTMDANTEVTQVTGHNGVNLCFRGDVNKLNVEGQEMKKSSTTDSKEKLDTVKRTKEATNKLIYQQGGQGSVNIVIGGSAKNIVIQSGNY